MAGKHSFRIDVDEEGGLTFTHRVCHEMGGHSVYHSEPVELTDPEAFVKAINDMVDAEQVVGEGDDATTTTLRKQMEAEALRLTINHVAALNNTPQKGVKRLTLAGTVGAVGTTTPNKPSTATRKG